MTLAVMTTGFFPSVIPSGLFNSLSAISFDICVVPGGRSGSAGSIG